MIKKSNLQKGFTLIELLIVIAIIGLLASIISTSVNSARKKARDTKRIADMEQVIKAIQMYHIDNNEYPGYDDYRGAQISSQCSSDLKSDLVNGEYISEFPSDPRANAPCDYASLLRNDTDFFYGWDSRHCCEGYDCVSINKLETDWGVEQLGSKYPDTDGDDSNGIQFVTGGGHANIGTGADFNYCFNRR